jgi:hypothetical protein
MDTITIIVGGLRVIAGFLNLFFIPGFAISLVFYPRFTDMGLIKRLVFSTVLGICSGIAFTLCMNAVLGVVAAPGYISLGLSVFSVLLLVVWLCEIWYLIDGFPAKLHQNLSMRYQEPLKYFSRIVNSVSDRFTATAMTAVVFHESVKSGRNQIDHTYLIDIGEEIDIQQVDEYKWKVSERALLPPPHPRTRYVELFVREYKEGGLSLIDDLQVYPVHVTRKPGIIFMGQCITPGNLKIADRLNTKTDTAEIQWIYHHDFHLFAILYSEDNLEQMVDRVLAKLDEIAVSIKSGSRVSSHVEDTQKLKDELDLIFEKRPVTPISTAARHPESRIFVYPTEQDRRELQAEIVRDLNVHHLTPDTFRSSDRMITTIKVPEKTDVEIKAAIDEIEDDEWLYE